MREIKVWIYPPAGKNCSHYVVELTGKITSSELVCTWFNEGCIFSARQLLSFDLVSINNELYERSID
jgi:hypothetical protein